jgi:hypothetical protein
LITSSARPCYGTKFGRKKEQAVTALLSHRNVEESAKAAGLSVATLKGWRAYRNSKPPVWSPAAGGLHTTARVQQNCGAVASVLFKLMADPATQPSIRARTRSAFWSVPTGRWNWEDFAARLARLEENRQRERGDHAAAYDAP